MAVPTSSSSSLKWSLREIFSYDEPQCVHAPTRISIGFRTNSANLFPVKTQTEKGNFVSHLMPPKFEACAKILHRITANYENIGHHLSDPEITLLRIPPCTELRSFIETTRDKGEGPRISTRLSA